MTLQPADLNYICDVVRQESSISLDASKKYLIISRLTPLAQQQGLNNLTALAAALRRYEPALRSKVVDALTTNETYFFRDAHPFDALRSAIIPELIAANRAVRRLRIWSAAASSGQEAYSIAMLLSDSFPELESWQVEITGTDISATALAHAQTGRYSDLEVRRGLPAVYLQRYFERAGSEWQIRPEIRQRVKFRQFNLNDPWTTLGVYDVIFLRNVLIYFDVSVRRTILERAADHAHPQSYLMLGAAETPVGVTPRWNVVSVGRTTACRKA